MLMAGSESNGTVERLASNIPAQCDSCSQIFGAFMLCRYRFSDRAGGYDLKPFSDIFPPISVGDLVKRGIDWKWGQQDGDGHGIATSTLDHDGWISVKWKAGGKNKYRYSEQAGGYDIELCRESHAAPAAPPLASVGSHSGSWRDLHQQRFYCSRETQREGPVCLHEGIVTQNHWTCCGETNRSSSCKLAPQNHSALLFSAGAMVKVHGMKTATWLNGAQGKVLSFNEKDCRYNVLVLGPAYAKEKSEGKAAALKAENLDASP
jgi:hypothetical protein